MKEAHLFHEVGVEVQLLIHHIELVFIKTGDLVNCNLHSYVGAYLVQTCSNNRSTFTTPNDISRFSGAISGYFGR